MSKGLWMTVALAALVGGGAVAVLVVHVTSSRGPLGDLKWSDAAPNWSPAGKKIAFASNRDDPSRPFEAIYVMNADGTGVQKVTTDTDAEMPRWSPDGTRLAYVSDLFQIDQYDQELYSDAASINVVQADGSGEKPVAVSGYTNDVQWSPNGNWIAFQAGKSAQGTLSLEIVRPSGRELRRVARDASTFAWSSDGRRLFFTRSSYGAGTTIYAIRLPSGKTTWLANFNGDSVEEIASSPDGSRIAFLGGSISTGGTLTNARVYLIDANGSNEHAISFIGDTDSNGLAWLPRPAHTLLYYSDGIYVASTNRRHARLINADGCCAAPSPDGKKLLFVEYDSSGHKSAIFLAPLNGHSFRRLTQSSH